MCGRHARRWPRARWRALLLALSLGAPGAAAAAEPRRLAIVVGNNAGSGMRPPLRFAEEDAGKLGRVLTELGGFRAADVHVLAGRPLADIHATFGEVRDRILAARTGGRRAVVLFYFSGHSDGQALEIGSEPWPFSEVRAALTGLGAEVRLAIIDSCKSGALLARKGGAPGPAFDIRFSDDLATSGEAVLTSSAADEMALESREIRASFFSHHLISGLRGAADSSGDGRVTLNEAYRYAFINTLLATSGTLSGPQHPAYDYSISGRGELVLTEVTARGSTLELPAGFDRILIADGRQRVLMAEVTSASAHRITVPPGEYYLQGRRGGRVHELRVGLREDESRVLHAEDFVARDGAVAVLKGGEPPRVWDEVPPTDGEVEPPALVFGAGFGATRGIADAVAWAPTVRLGLRAGDRWGWLADLELSSTRPQGFRESTARFGLGLHLSTAPGAARAQLAWRVVTGPTLQEAAGTRFATWAAGAGPSVGGTIAVGRYVGVFAAFGLDVMVFRRDQAYAVTLWPSGFVGLELGRF